MKVGESVYLYPLQLGNAWRKNKEPVKATIEKIGRKYVYLSGGYGQFYVENGRQKTEFSANYLLFFNEQELLDYKEKIDLQADIQHTFLYAAHKISLENLRKIYKLME